MPTRKLNFDRLHELYKLLINSNSIYKNMYQAYIEAGLKAFELDLGIIARIQNDSYTIVAVSPNDMKINRNDCFQLKDTYCSEIIRQKKAIGLHQIGQDETMCKHPAYQRMKLESFIAAPIWVNGGIYGSINFTSPIIGTKPFTSKDLEFITLMANGLGSLIERDLLEQEKNKAIAAMHESTVLFTNAFEYAPIGMALLSPKGGWLKVNRSLQDITGYDEKTLLQIDFQSITYPDDLSKDVDTANKLLANKIISYQIEKRYIHRSGKIIWVNLSVSLVHYEDGTPRYFVAQIENIDKRKRIEMQLEKKQRSLAKANNKLANLASHDLLTGLPNRRLFKEKFNDELSRCLRKNCSFSVAIIDIDHFKHYNDQFGHLEGDIALKKVAHETSLAKRQFDTIARFGGEEFILLLPETDEFSSLTVCERIRHSIESISDLKSHITISIGYTSYKPVSQECLNDHLLLEKILNNADRALYIAKESGRNQVQYINDSLKINNECQI